MKKALLQALLIAATWPLTEAYAQAPKFVLLEEFTGMNCSPCAVQHQHFDSLLAQTKGKVHHIAYHTSWPGKDVMYLANQAQVDHMVTQYQVTGIPNVEMNGNKRYAQPVAFQKQEIERQYSSGSPIKISVTDSVNGPSHVATVKVTTVGEVPPGIYVLRTLITEHIRFQSAPGRNAEKDFPDVFRKMISTEAGDAIILPAEGKSLVLTYKFTADPSWRPDQLQLLAYVQNTGSNEVLNSGATGDPLNTNFVPATGAKEQHPEKAEVRKVVVVSADQYIQLGQNYPNPANEGTIIPLKAALPFRELTLQVLDAGGKVVATISVPNGTEQISLNTSTYRMGTYLYRLMEGNQMLASHSMEVVH